MNYFKKGHLYMVLFPLVFASNYFPKLIETDKAKGYLDREILLNPTDKTEFTELICILRSQANQKSFFLNYK